jgi:alkylation response protein AidB-like acyl-CoA dehydrogenase
MDTRITEFKPIEIVRYVPELDLLGNPILNDKEKEFLADLYDFMEKELDPDLKRLEDLNYIVEEPTQDKKRDIVIGIMKKLAKNGYYSTILNTENYEIGRIVRNTLIAFAICGGRWSDHSERYIAGNYSIEMGRLSGGTLYCNPVNFASDERQREKFLIPVAKNGQIGASAMTEFNAGSDIFRMEMRLQEIDNKLILKGKKLFITNGMIADYIVVYGRLDNGQLAAVIVDTEHQKL